MGQKRMEIKKCTEADIARAGQFYDDVVLWLDEHINYPKWKYRVYPGENSVREMTAEGSQYLCLVGETIVGAFALNDKPQGHYRKIRWSREVAEGAYLIIHALAVEPGMHKKGTASEVIRFCMDRAREECYEAIRAEIVPTNTPARMLFEKNGFHYAGNVAPETYIEGIPEFSLYEYNI